jgi:hypothetical protein
MNEGLFQQPPSRASAFLIPSFLIFNSTYIAVKPPSTATD